MVDDPQPRRELVQAVARLARVPLYARLQRETRPGARRALIVAAIEEIRADNIADELQAAEIEKLEARLAELH
jgi:hypothetical protein